MKRRPNRREYFKALDEVGKANEKFYKQPEVVQLYADWEKEDKAAQAEYEAKMAKIDERRQAINELNRQLSEDHNEAFRSLRRTNKEVRKKYNKKLKSGKIQKIKDRIVKPFSEAYDRLWQEMIDGGWNGNDLLRRKS